MTKFLGEHEKFSPLCRGIRRDHPSIRHDVEEGMRSFHYRAIKAKVDKCAYRATTLRLPFVRNTIENRKNRRNNSIVVNAFMSLWLRHNVLSAWVEPRRRVSAFIVGKSLN